MTLPDCLLLYIIDILIIKKKVKILLQLQYLNIYVYNYLHYNNKIQICVLKKYLTKGKILNYCHNYRRGLIALVSNHIRYNRCNSTNENMNINNFPYYVDKEYNNTPINRNSDIITSFIVIGTCITKIELTAHNVVIARNYYLKSNLVSFIPFINGIQMLKLAFTELRIKVYCEKLKKIYSVRCLLDTKYRRYIVNNIIHNKHNFIDFKNKKIINHMKYDPPGLLTFYSKQDSSFNLK